MSVGIRRHSGPERHRALARAFQGLRPIGVAQPHTARLGDSQRLFRAPRDRLAFGLRHQRHDADGQIIGLGQIDGEEPHAAVAQGQQEGRIAREPVELGDDQDGAGDTGQVQRLGEFRPIRVAPAFHLCKPGDHLGAARGSKCIDALALRFEAEPTGALTGGRDPLVGDEPWW